MGYLLDERKFLDTNIVGAEARIQSQYARFLDKNPTYVTYFHINNIESMVDLGFQNVERRLGNNSPIRYNEIKDFPIYGMDELQPDMAVEEEGLNMNMSSNGVILPNTITPYPDDLFVLGTTAGSLIFRVTNVQLDSIRSNGFYMIDYQLEYTDEEFFDYLYRQTSDTFTCHIQNIGSEDKVIISDDVMKTMIRVEGIASKISDFYRILFYDKRYNSFLYSNDIEGIRLYDSLLTMFINKNNVFEGKGRYDTLVLADEDPDYKNEYAYHDSIYRAIEERRPDIIKERHYMAGFVNNPLSVFHYWRDSTVFTTNFGIGCNSYIRPEILDLFINAKNHYNGWLHGDDEEDKERCCSALDISIPVGDDYARPEWVKPEGSPPKSEEEYPIEDDDVVADMTESHPDNKTFDNMIQIQPEYSDQRETVFDRLEKAERTMVNSLGIEILVEEEYKEDKNENTAFPDKQEYLDENEAIVGFKEKDNTVINSEGMTFHISDIPLEYRRPNSVPLGDSILHHVIVMYLSGSKINVRDIDLKSLENHIEYMRPNHETFILTPILLFVIRKIFDSLNGV